jgi:hypothetical protein
MMTLVSKKLAGIGFVSVELEIGRKTAAESTKTLQQFVTSGPTSNTEPPSVSDMNFNLVAFLKLKRFDHSGRKADRETVSPFGDLHGNRPWIYVRYCVYPRNALVNAPRRIGKKA